MHVDSFIIALVYEPFCLSGPLTEPTPARAPVLLQQAILTTKFRDSIHRYLP